MQAKAQQTKHDARMAQPAPCYGYTPGETAMRITIEAPGWATSALLIAPYGPARSDQFIVELDGDRLPEVLGLTVVFDLLRGRVPRRLSRRQLASM